ncbi:MAG: hypothetical protein LBS73_07140, partial [Campylobacteraceae bacterium]|nr:hypothetical protein [Campylobacteraceae bacterium]
RRNANMRRVSEGQLHLGGVSLRHFLSEKKVARVRANQKRQDKRVEIVTPEYRLTMTQRTKLKYEKD